MGEEKITGCPVGDEKLEMKGDTASPTWAEVDHDADVRKLHFAFKFVLYLDSLILDSRRSLNILVDTIPRSASALFSTCKGAQIPCFL